MPPFNTGTQLTGAVTDLFNTVLLIPLTLILRKQLPNELASSRMWLRMMLLICIGNVLGALVHLFRWSFTGVILLWAILYPILMAACNCFLRLSMHSFSNGLQPSKCFDRGLNIAMLLVWILLVALFLVRRKEPIRVFMVYAIMTVVPGFFFHCQLALRGHRGAALLLAAFLPLIFGAVLMMLQTGHFVLILPFDHNSIMHLCITFGLVIFFLSARVWEKEPLSVS